MVGAMKEKSRLLGCSSQVSYGFKLLVCSVWLLPTAYCFLHVSPSSRFSVIEMVFVYRISADLFLNFNHVFGPIVVSF